jgi:GT2 family glycosyltransferase
MAGGAPNTMQVPITANQSGCQSVNRPEVRQGITFCIMTLSREQWLERTLRSIHEYCPAKYSVKILSQGMPGKKLISLLERLENKRFELIVSSMNLGVGGGRRLLAGLVESPFTMMLDDDMYLTDGAIRFALRVFRREPTVGAIGMPQYDLDGRMISAGGNLITIRNGVIHRQRPKLDFDKEWIEVNDVNAGAMLYRTEMRESFSWDPKAWYLEDLDKSLQINAKNRWRQAIVPQGRLIHDRSWIRQCTVYEEKRFDGFSLQRSYRYIRAKWGLRFAMKRHLFFELVYPTLTLTRCRWLSSAFNRFVEMRVKARNTRPLASRRKGYS